MTKGIPPSALQHQTCTCSAAVTAWCCDCNRGPQQQQHLVYIELAPVDP